MTTSSNVVTLELVDLRFAHSHYKHDDHLSSSSKERDSDQSRFTDEQMSNLSEVEEKHQHGYDCVLKIFFKSHIVGTSK